MKAQTHEHLYVTRVVSGLQISSPYGYWDTQCPLPAFGCYPTQTVPEIKEGRTPSWHAYKTYCSERSALLGLLVILTQCLNYSICHKSRYLSHLRNQGGDEKHLPAIFFKCKGKTQTWAPVWDMFRPEVQQHKSLFVWGPPWVPPPLMMSEMKQVKYRQAFWWGENTCREG